MATKNLGLTTIGGSDYVSYETLNKNFEALDVLGADYVTETGTSGMWTYRKWKSGFAEFWGKKTFANTKNTGQLPIGCTYPFALKGATVVANVSGGVDGRNDSHISYVNTHNSNTALDCYVYKPSDANLSYWAFYHVQGMMA